MARVAGRARSVLLGTLRRFSEDRGSQAAAAIAYYSLVSLFPLLIFLVGAFGLLVQGAGLRARLVDTLLAYSPSLDGSLRSLLTNAVVSVGGRHGVALGLGGLLGMAWTASSLFGQIRAALNTAFDVQHRRPLVRQKLLDLGLVVLTGGFFVASSAATGLLEFAGRLPVLEQVPGAAWALVILAAPVVFLLAVFTFLYWLVPAHHHSVREVWPGAVAAAILFQAAQFLFSLYLGHFAHYDRVYGSLGALVAFLAWTYVSAVILILGAELAAEAAERRQQRRPPEAVPTRPSTRLRELLRSLIMSDTALG